MYIYVYPSIKEGRLPELFTICVETAFKNHVIDGKLKGRVEFRGRRRRRRS
jgi:hypothetical protein